MEPQVLWGSRERAKSSNSAKMSAAGVCLLEVFRALSIIGGTFQDKPGRRSLLAELLDRRMQSDLVQGQLHLAVCGLLHECSARLATKGMVAITTLANSAASGFFQPHATKCASKG
jgi:hypothetical protein